MSASYPPSLSGGAGALHNPYSYSSGPPPSYAVGRSASIPPPSGLQYYGVGGGHPGQQQNYYAAAAAAGYYGHGYYYHQQQPGSGYQNYLQTS